MTHGIDRGKGSGTGQVLIHPNTAARKIIRSARTLAMLALLCILCVPISAQRLPLRLYTAEDGLWSGFINYMMRDSRGFLWFCTRDGLSRFDGYRFTNYKIAGGPLSQNFTYIFESRAGIFWITIGDRYLYRYDTRSVMGAEPLLHAGQSNDEGNVLLHAQLVSANFAGELLEDRNGRLWAAGAGLWIIEDDRAGASFHEVNLPLPQDWKSTLIIRALAVGDDGSLWQATNHGLLRRLPDGREARYYLGNDPLREDIRSLLFDRSGYVWVSYLGAIDVFRPEPLSKLTDIGAFSSIRLAAPHQNPEAVLPQREGELINLSHLAALDGLGSMAAEIYQHSNRQIWIVIKNRLVLFDGQKFTWYEDTRGPFGHPMEDLDGDLWLTTNFGGGGVVRYSLRGLMSYGVADGLGDQSIASIYEDHNGRLNVVSPGWLVNRLGARQLTPVHANIPEAALMWTSPLGFRDHTGQWWFLTRRGLYRFAAMQRLEELARTKPKAYTTLDGLPAQWVYCMFEDSQGDLWISVRDSDRSASGLVRWRRSAETFRRFTDADGLPPIKSAASFAEDRAGNLWFGFYEGGLARYSGKRFTSFTPADGLPEGFITALHMDHLGRLWLTSSGGGLARIDDPTSEHPRFLRFTTQEGLFSNNARALTEDLAGNIYVGTVRGLDRLTPETGQVRHFGLGDGLAGDFVTTAYRDRRGILWFGTFNGLSRLDPQPERVVSPPPIRIEQLRIAGVEQPLSEFGALKITGLELTPSQNNLQIDFSSLSPARATSLRYQYKLQGVDRDWSSQTEQRTVHYANLAAGSYRFLVRAVDSSGRSTLQPATVEFHIMSVVWQRWWFLGVVAMTIGCVVTLLYRYRVTYLLELERVRTHIASDLHDDIGASLSQIAVLSEVVRHRVGGTEAVSQPLSTIASTSRELVDSMSDIVWAINPKRDSLGDLAHRMRRFASDLFTANDIEFEFNPCETDRAIRLDADVRRQLFLIFKESTHNIVRHSGCSKAAIELRMEHHAVTLVLRDDGKGFDTTQTHYGHGLSNMSRRAGKLGALLSVNSRPGGGTIVSLKVRLSRRAQRSNESLAVHRSQVSLQ